MTDVRLERTFKAVHIFISLVKMHCSSTVSQAVTAPLFKSTHRSRPLLAKRPIKNY